MFNPELLREKLKGVKEIPSEIIRYIHEQRWLHIWVPQKYGGLGYRFEEGLKVLKQLAQMDGSLGWMVTLCSGANYFSRNLRPEVAMELFKHPKTCFGGSGMIGGTAELKGSGFVINGTWKFATGAPHLSHFTLNAVITKHGKPALNEQGEEIVRSFIVPKQQVTIIPDWKAMGMKATGTYSFKVHNIWVDEKYSFVYNEFFTDTVLDKIPFRIFADLTLLANYIGLTHHFIEEAVNIRPNLNIISFQKELEKQEDQIYMFAGEIEKLLENNREISLEKQTEIHLFGEELMKELSKNILEIYFQLGIRASHTDEPIHQVFCDYFTVTQHANFRRKIDQ